MHEPTWGATGKEVRVAINCTGATTNELVAAVAGKQIRVLAFFVRAAGATVLTFKSAATAITGAIPLIANGDLALQGNWCPAGMFQTVAGEALNLTSSGNVDQDGWLLYQLV